MARGSTVREGGERIFALRNADARQGMRAGGVPNGLPPRRACNAAVGCLT